MINQFLSNFSPIHILICVQVNCEIINLINKFLNFLLSWLLFFLNIFHS